MKLLLIISIALITQANASPINTYIPSNAYTYQPVIEQTINHLWPDFSNKEFFYATIEQETCITLTHKKCFSPYAELKTKRERGTGFGQTTIAYNKDGTERFNTWRDLKKQYPNEMRDFSMANIYKPELQATALILLTYSNWLKVKTFTNDQPNTLRFMAAMYNGGSMTKDRLLCNQAIDCDSSVWYNNVSDYSTKSRKIIPGYGRSPFTINRSYVKLIDQRMPKYKQLIR